MGNGQWAMGIVPLSIPLPTGFDHTLAALPQALLRVETHNR
jgi:hypothetical protein